MSQSAYLVHVRDPRNVPLADVVVERFLVGKQVRHVAHRGGVPVDDVAVRCRCRRRVGHPCRHSIADVGVGDGRLRVRAGQDEVHDHRHRYPTAVTVGKPAGGRSASPAWGGESDSQRHCTQHARQVGQKCATVPDGGHRRSAEAEGAVPGVGQGDSQRGWGKGREIEKGADR
jgi:hypothetical protein